MTRQFRGGSERFIDRLLSTSQLMHMQLMIIQMLTSLESLVRLCAHERAFIGVNQAVPIKFILVLEGFAAFTILKSRCSKGSSFRIFFSYIRRNITHTYAFVHQQFCTHVASAFPNAKKSTTARHLMVLLEIVLGFERLVAALAAKMTPTSMHSQVVLLQPRLLMKTFAAIGTCEIPFVRV